MALTLEALASRLGCELEGDAACLISGIATLDDAADGDLSFLASAKYRGSLGSTKASAVIIAEHDRDGCPTNRLITKDPYLAYARAVALLYPELRPAAGIDKSAVVDPDAQVDSTAIIGANAFIGPGVVVGAEVQIGPGCVVDRDVTIGRESHLVANVTLRGRATLGKRCLIQPGAVIGSDGFGFANDQGRWVKIPQVGGVVIGDDVEIGACTTIDRGALSDTVLENGVKLDNQIQIAHNVIIGEDTAIAGCTGIAGSTRIGRRCAIGGHVGIVGHLTIADGVQISAKSFVGQSIPETGYYSSGSPLESNSQWRKNFVRMKQLDEMARRIKTLEKMVYNLSSNEGI